ncbi:serine hydrolase domain-containing protein [Brevibacillus choshinensis]|uniref:Beta-lactamase family protein n=1 Tax=Brevibacillus choshinensis TaxID=54911 RepID=A0ABX7FRP6_BRECH|nr:serine hydrolase domain-containing protein [Brevibacillus choshinensis]QRG68911.1 beta-lactamase family protein [Brevibacillus choshinensis]
MDDVRDLLQEWVDNGWLPGVSLRVLQGQGVCFSCDVGVRSIETRQPVTPDTLYDLASLTKVTATLPALLLLMQEGRIRPDDPIGNYFSDCPKDKRSITIAQLLTHTSGLPADLMERRRDSQLSLPDLLYHQELLQEPGTKVVYSDLGMIWLGLLIEAVTGERLDLFVNKQVFTPLGMNRTLYCPNNQDFRDVAHTEFCTLTGSYLAGEVHDEKAFAMGGIAGHAGLFATADDLCRYAASWMSGEDSLLDREWKQRAIHCQTPAGTERRGYGWQCNDPTGQLSCGSGFHPDSYGHTGFTGTSIWIDPVHEWAVILLTNAVHLGRDHLLRQLRPTIHDAVTAHLQRA